MEYQKYNSFKNIDFIFVFKSAKICVISGKNGTQRHHPDIQNNSYFYSMKSIRKIFFLLLLSFFLIPSDVSARAGGGGRSGGGGSYSGGGYYGGGYYGRGYYYGYGHGTSKVDPKVAAIVIISTVSFIAIAFFGITFLVIARNKSAKKAIKKASSSDSFWNETKMLEHAKEVYTKIQDSWSKNDLTDVLHLVTNDFFIHNQHFLHRYSKMNLKNIVKDIDFKTVKIVKVIDKDNNNEDTMVVYLKGNLIDYLVSSTSGIVIEGDKNEKDMFEDIYVFFRRDDKWLLNQIINDPASNYIREVKQNIG